MRARLGFLLVTALAGCVSVGNQTIGHEPESAIRQQIAPGTPAAQVLQRYGPPVSKSFTSEGAQVWTYTYAYATPKAASFIPIVGVFAGGSNVEQTQVTVLFDAEGRVRDVAYSKARSDVLNGGQ